jgi:putative ABC transport system substrate-binding protein
MLKKLTIAVLFLALVPAWAYAAQKRAHILMVTWRGETEAEKGFKKGMEAAGYAVDYTTFDAKQNKDSLSKFMDGLDRSKKIDLIYTFGTTATQVAMSKIKDVPIVFTIVADPVSAGIAASWESSGNNVTGASHLVPFESQYKALSRVKKITKLGMIYNPKEANSVIARDQMKRLGVENGYTLVEAIVSDKSEIEKAVQALIGKVDYIYLPSDSLIISNGADVMRLINRYRIPTFSAVEGLVRDNGALVGLVSSYFKVGELAAQKAVKVLEGAKPTEVPVGTLVTFSFLVNAKTMKEIGAVVPVTVLRGAEVIR